MDKWIPIPLGLKSYQPRSGTQSVERLVNLYAEVSEQGGKTPVTLYSDPGLLAWTEVGDGPIRGLHRAFGYVWAVSGTDLYAINEGTATATLIGTVAGSQPVRMDHNNTHIGIAGQPYLYAANISGITTIATVTDLVGFCVQDGYGIAVERNTQSMWISGTDDLTSWNALDFTTADARPDNVVTVVSSQREPWVFKGETIEVFANTGAAAFPFSRVAFIALGCIAPGSAVVAGGSPIWLGRDAEGGTRVFQAQGYNGVPISTPAIEKMIAATSSPETAEAFAYSLADHTHYVLNFSDLSLAYDLTTGMWRERESYGLARWRAQAHCVSAGKHLVGDYATGEIYELSLTTYDEDGEPLVRETITPPLADGILPIFVHGFELEFQAGVGLTSGQGSDPTMMLAYSEDDGHTYSNEIEASLGAIGQYRWRAQFNRMGMGRNRSFRFRFSDPTNLALLGLRARVEEGRQ